MEIHLITVILCATISSMESDRGHVGARYSDDNNWTDISVLAIDGVVHKVYAMLSQIIFFCVNVYEYMKRIVYIYIYHTSSPHVFGGR